ncbi:transposase [Streptomyces sp. NBC_00388]
MPPDRWLPGRFATPDGRTSPLAPSTIGHGPSTHSSTFISQPATASALTAPLLRYFSDAPLRRRVTAAANTVESFNRFSQRIASATAAASPTTTPSSRRRLMKVNALFTNAVIFHSALDIVEIAGQLLEEGWEIGPEGLAHISPDLTEYINRFGEYSTHELGISPTRTPRSSTSTSPRCASRT